MPSISRAKRSTAMPCSALRPATFGLPTACADHTRTVPHQHDERSGGTTRIWDHTLHNGPRSEPRASGITVPITGNQQNGRSYHTRHNGHSAPRAFVPRLHNGRLHDGASTTGLQEAQLASSHRKRNVDHIPRTPNVLRFSCRRGAWRKLSKCNRSRAPKAVSCKRRLDGSGRV